jgi:hypothetical protein
MEFLQWPDCDPFNLTHKRRLYKAQPWTGADGIRVPAIEDNNNSRSIGD